MCIRYMVVRLDWDTGHIPAVAELLTQMLLLKEADSKL